MSPCLRSDVTCFLQQGKCLLVVVADGVTSEPTAADRVCCGDACQNRVATAADLVGPSGESGSSSATAANALAWAYRCAAS